MRPNSTNPSSSLAVLEAQIRATCPDYVYLCRVTPPQLCYCANRSGRTVTISECCSLVCCATNEQFERCLACEYGQRLAASSPFKPRPALESMLEDLACARLEVGIVPAPERRTHRWQGVRMVFQHNPGWYRELAATYQRSRRVRAASKSDPRFKRADVTRVIHCLLSGGTCSYLAGPLLSAAARIHREQLADIARLQAELALELAACFPWDIPADAAAMGVAI